MYNVTVNFAVYFKFRLFSFWGLGAYGGMNAKAARTDHSLSREECNA